MRSACRLCGERDAVVIGTDTLDRMEVLETDVASGHVRVFHPSSGALCVVESSDDAPDLMMAGDDEWGRR